MTEQERNLITEAEARLHTTGQLLIHLATFLDGAHMADRAGRTAFIIADADHWEALLAAVAKETA